MDHKLVGFFFGTLDIMFLWFTLACLADFSADVEFIYHTQDIEYVGQDSVKHLTIKICDEIL